MSFVETPSFKIAVYAKGDQKAPKLALVLPGRLDTKDYAHMVSHVDHLARLGYYALSFDPPGTWESPGGLGLFTTSNYIKAVSELIEMLGDKPTLLVGHSRGGAVAMLSSDNLNVEGLVLAMANYGNATPPDPKRIKGDVLIEYRDLPPGSRNPTKEFYLPLAYFKDLQKHSPADRLRKFDGPKLMIWGTHDKYIEAKKVHEIYESLRPPKDFLELDVDHDYRHHPNLIIRVNQAITEFIQTSVK
jgi:pimeloyl-ACP methyl ester carboxylesterase